ncbi:MAG: bifunctional phosphopantothenoylcysteine decarboxylase/phosphopantothenate--cysteine ligase CoaBC [Thermoflavifilum sp.]|nr:bifunctional phosphopantothenoylcysteine decarboxylase/phosphopantothenate--cysteine ligase CoaBC [Thermoflavifilum sp.]
MWQGKKLILGVTGSIAAYKSAELVRLLVKQGADVQVVMTPEAHQFITPLTLSTLSRHPVLTEISTDATWHNHVQLGREADILLIAPATAHTLAKMASGLCDNLLLAVYLSATCPVTVAPAMDEDMWFHPATQTQLDKLAAHGVDILEVNQGELASGLLGWGRMMEPADIIATLQERWITPTHQFQGKKVLITAGPTREPFDPVRYISNYSSGKMGFALAKTFAWMGAEVQLVAGPTSIMPPHHPRIHLTRVETASQMKQACQHFFPESDITIMAAAVADYRPQQIATEKIKKHENTLQLTLEKNEDILLALGQQKQPQQWLIGFALETHHDATLAMEKMQHKRLDMIILNSLDEPASAFHHDTNKISIFDRFGNEMHFPVKHKSAVAHDIAMALLRLMQA